MGASLKDFENIAKGIAIIGMVVGLVAVILGKFQATTAVSSNTVANSTIASMLTEVSTLPTWVGIAILIAVFVYMYKRMGTVGGKG